MQHSKHHKGFTMLEMALVVTIIGLIIGGVMAGQHLMRSAELRGVLSEYDQYLKAIKQFQDKFQALPGDTDNNGRIGAVTNIANGVQDTTTPATVAEQFLVWSTLKTNKLIDGTYTGAGSGTAAAAVPGVNVPASKVSGAGWTFNYYLQTSNSTNIKLWADSYGHVFWFGAKTANTATTSPAITGIEANNIDSKLDDGSPGLGKVRAWRTDSSTSPAKDCTVAANDTTQNAATYNQTTSGNTCSLIFITGF
ncbi:MAG: prepilin-type N-terminal cleavage/methylation domain-containing protein [Alphaproteobacteria bacterium]|nr:prepilin-type N-terminal cleavage/methylation domain-containing protein [Alphaproteobacteria bacterium]